MVLGCRELTVETFTALPSGGPHIIPQACGVPQAAVTPGELAAHPPLMLFFLLTTWVGVESPCSRIGIDVNCDLKKRRKGALRGAHRLQQGHLWEQLFLHIFHFVFPKTYQFEYLNHAGQYYNVKGYLSIYTPK